MEGGLQGVETVGKGPGRVLGSSCDQTSHGPGNVGHFYWF